MGVRLPEKPALAQCLTHSPRARTRISSGRAKQEMPAQAPCGGDRLPGGCCRFATVRRRKSNSLLGNLRHRLAGSRGAIGARGTVRQAICQANDLEIEIGRQAAQSLSSRRTRPKLAEIFDLGGHGSATSFAIEAACGMWCRAQTAAGSRAIRNLRRREPDAKYVERAEFAKIAPRTEGMAPGTGPSTTRQFGQLSFSRTVLSSPLCRFPSNTVTPCCLPTAPAMSAPSPPLSQRCWRQTRKRPARYRDRAPRRRRASVLGGQQHHGRFRDCARYAGLARRAR